ncbi:hypothetical protein BH23CHL2_BH23CHL2_21090 [soil metagenome]
MFVFQRIPHLLIIGSLCVGMLSGCMSDGGGDEPTQTPIVIVPTGTTTPGQPTPTATVEPTATTEATATREPSPTPAPTPGPTVILVPTPTRAPIIAPTPTPESSGGVQIPGDLLSILPVLGDLPAGMMIVDEGEASIELVAADFEDEVAREEQLRDWEFQSASFREVQLPDDQIVDAANQPYAMLLQAVLLGSPEAAQLEMNSFIDDVVLADPELTTTEVSIDPLGDTTRAVTGSGISGDNMELNLGVLGITAGPISFHLIAASGIQYDPLPDLIAAARATLAYLGYSGVPEPGDVLLETDFSNWVTGELESGELFFSDDGYYHVLVDRGGGSFVSAYSVDHEPFTDVAVSVDMRMLSNSPDGQGCVLTRVDQVNQQYDYALCIDGVGNVEALYEEFDAAGNYGSEPLISSGTVTVPPPTEWTTLTIISRGDEFWFLIHGEIIGSARHSGPPGGSAGIIVNNFAGEDGVPAEFAFTNLVVQAIE